MGIEGGADFTGKRKIASFRLNLAENPRCLPNQLG